MTNRATLYKISESDLKKEIKSFRENMVERYLECPVCGYEPFPEAVFVRGVPQIVTTGYNCLKCHAITLTIAVRVKKEFIPMLLSDSAKETSQSSIQTLINTEEEREMTARQKMLSIIDPARMYQKLRNTAILVRNRSKYKGKKF